MVCWGYSHIEEGVAIDVDNIVANALGVVTNEVNGTSIKDLGEVLGSLGGLGAREGRLDRGLGRLVGEEGLGRGGANGHGEGGTGDCRSEGKGSTERHWRKP